MSAIFVYWAPAKDRTKMLGSSTSGAWMGNIIALPLGGLEFNFISMLII